MKPSDEENKFTQIIKAATEVFAQCGYAGARMDVIARKAGVNKATIYYNIGNKEKLYEAVLNSIFGNELLKMEEKINRANSPEEKLGIYIHGFADAIDKNPAIPNIMMWEHASGGLHLPEIITNKIALLMKYLAEILKEGEVQKEFESVNPMLMQFFIIPALMFYKTSAPIRESHHEFPAYAKNLPQNVSETFATEMAEFLIRGLKKH